MGTAALEQETERRTPAREAAPQREVAFAAPAMDAGRPVVMDARSLLGLQATAGNAAVASLIAESREPAVETTEPSAGPGESDEELSTLEAAADPGAGSEDVTQKSLADLNALGDGAAPEEAPAGGSEAGSPIEERPPPPAPDVASVDPAQALATVGSLPAGAMLGALGGVSAAVAMEGAREHQQLVAAPPRRATQDRKPAGPKQPSDTTLPNGLPTAIPRVAEGPTIRVEEQAGPVPHLALDGSADPAQIQRQRGHVTQALVSEAQAGSRLAALPMGEDEIYPTVSSETLVATLPGSPGGKVAAGSANPADAEDPASIVAEQEKGPEIRAAVNVGLDSMTRERQSYREQAAEGRVQADQEMAQLEQTHNQQQTAERDAAKEEIYGLRGQWTGEQRQLIQTAEQEADARTSTAVQSVMEQRTQAQQEAAAHYQQGQQEAQKHRREGEQQAAAERQKAQNQDSGGVLGAIESAAQSLVDRARHAVQAVVDRARQLVQAAIERAQQLATAALERARQAIVATISVAATALTTIGDRVLTAFPQLRDRFRRAIQERVQRAEAAVNRLAIALKQAVQGALNRLGTGLSTLVAQLTRGWEVAVMGVRSAVAGAIDFGRSAIAAFGAFAGLVKDVAANPGQWLSNLAAAARDGVRNHLWGDLRGAVQSWFSEKVQLVLGLGSSVWSLLQRGGLSAMQVANVAWEGLQAIIPQTVIWILIEKLVALIVPAAAAVLLIIQGLQAAWASIGKIVQAFDAFMNFLKGVKWGNAGPLLGRAVGAGAVAVIEFISQFLLQRLMGAAGKVAGKIRGLAARIGNRLASAGRGVKRGLGWLGANGGAAAAGLKRFVRQSAAKPQVQWHAWRLEGLLQENQPKALAKLRQVKADKTLDPSLKVDFLRAVRSRVGKTSSNARQVMTDIVKENSERYCLKGPLIDATEIKAAAPLTKLVSLSYLFERKMLTDDYRARFANYDEWLAAVRADPGSFVPSIHLKSEAEAGRWWSPLADAHEPTLEHAIERRQLSEQYQDGAVRLSLPASEALKMNFRKPTALDAMFFDPWQPPPKAAQWGFISSQNGSVLIREAVTDPIALANCSGFELLANEAAVAAIGDQQLVGAMETLP